MNKDNVIAGTALVAPLWMSYLEQFNTVIATLTGVVALATISFKLYKTIKGGDS